MHQFFCCLFYICVLLYFDGDYMDNVLDKKENLIKKSVIINLLLIPCWILSIFISVNSMNNVLPMLELMTLVLKMDSLDRDMFLNVIEFFFRYFPTIVFVGGKIYIFNINKEIRKLNEEYDFELLEQIERNKKDNIGCVVIDEEEVKKINDIVDKFKKLPRRKQVEILNYIKGDLIMYDKELSSITNLINSSDKESLLTEFQDVLYSDIDDNENSYTKKKEK